MAAGTGVARGATPSSLTTGEIIAGVITVGETTVGTTDGGTVARETIAGGAIAPTTEAVGIAGTITGAGTHDPTIDAGVVICHAMFAGGETSRCDRYNISALSRGFAAAQCGALA
jgi:hypothetical protein